jgi:hypothetical protein
MCSDGNPPRLIGSSIADEMREEHRRRVGKYPPARWNPNLYGYYGYYVPPGYALGTPYYVLGYPVPHYGYRPWRRWWW